MKHLPDLFETWNRKRGDGHKITAQLVFFGVFAILYALVHPWALGSPILVLSPWMHYSLVLAAFAVFIVCTFMWFWFSGDWPHGKKTHKENPSRIRTAYADMMLGMTAKEAQAKDKGLGLNSVDLIPLGNHFGNEHDEDNLTYKHYYRMWKYYKFSAGWMLKCGLTLMVAGALAGCVSWGLIGAWLGYTTARIYHKHLQPETKRSIEFTEYEFGRVLGWAYYLLLIEPIIWQIVRIL